MLEFSIFCGFARPVSLHDEADVCQNKYTTIGISATLEEPCVDKNE